MSKSDGVTNQNPHVPVTGNMDKTYVGNTAGDSSKSEAHFRKTLDKAVNQSDKQNRK
jgi:hypothetical protein